MKLKCTPAVPTDAANVASIRIEVTTSVTPGPTKFPVTAGGPVFWNSAVGTVVNAVTIETDPLGVDSLPSDSIPFTVTADVPPVKPAPPILVVVSAMDDPTLQTI
jgi:hypothetical protein